MTPLPKRKHSKRRSRVRRATLVTNLPELSTCPNCGVRTLPHRACIACGVYSGRTVIAKDKPSNVNVTTRAKE